MGGISKTKQNRPRQFGEISLGTPCLSCQTNHDYFTVNDIKVSQSLCFGEEKNLYFQYCVCREYLSYFDGQA